VIETSAVSKKLGERRRSGAGIEVEEKTVAAQLSARRVRIAAVAVLAGAALGAVAPGADAGLLPGSGCNYPPATHPFAPWNDGASYSLMQGGSFENGAQGWTLAGGAAVVAGNESFHTAGSADSHSLSIPAASVAVTPPFCVNLTRPTFRFFVANSGSSSSRLRVKVVFRSLLGILGILDGGTISAGSSWQPSPVLLATLNAPLGSNSVQFTFVPSDLAGSWRIDDVYVDPWVDRG